MAEVTNLTREEIVVKMGAIVARLNKIVQSANSNYELIIQGCNKRDTADRSMGERLYPFTYYDGGRPRKGDFAMRFDEFQSRANALSDLSARVHAGQLREAEAAGALRELFMGLAPNRLGQDDALYAHATARIETMKVEGDGTLSYGGKDGHFADKIVMQAITAYKASIVHPYYLLDPINFRPNSWEWDTSNGGPLIVDHTHLDGFLEFVQTWEPSTAPATNNPKPAQDGGPQ
jgi:hypothetical protein